MRKGDTGENVKKLQTALNRAGSNLNVDGVYGEKTENAVKNFQEDHGLKVDGIVGDQTMSALRPFMVDYSALREAIEKCLDEIEQLPIFKQIEEMMYGR